MQMATAAMASGRQRGCERESMPGDSHWTAAIAEHGRVVQAFVAEMQRVPIGAWHQPTAPGKWSPAAVALHICQSYEFGRAAASGGAAMRLRTTRVMAWLSRSALLPLFLAAARFPRGAKAPAEVRPDDDAARALSIDAAVARLERAAADAVDALRLPSATPVTHAYFGPLPPRVALRLLSAHTRHHAAALAQRAAREPARA
jgi:DinB superfamily